MQRYHLILETDQDGREIAIDALQHAGFDVRRRNRDHSVVLEEADDA